MESENWGYTPGKENLLSSIPQILNFLMECSQFYLIYAANCFPSLLCFGSENQSKLSCWRAYEDITVFGSLSYPSSLDEKFLSFPSWDKGFITTLAYYWSKETLNGNVTLGWLFIGPIWMHWMHCFKFTGGKNTLFLKCQHFLIYEELFSFFFFLGILFFLFFLFFLLFFFLLLLCVCDCIKNIPILKHFTGFLKASSNNFSSLYMLFCCWSGTQPPKPSGHSSLHTRGEERSVLILWRFRDSLLLTLEGDLGKNDSWIEHDLRIFSKDSEGAQTNMEYKNFSMSRAWERSGGLQKEGKLYQG